MRDRSDLQYALLAGLRPRLSQSARAVDNHRSGRTTPPSLPSMNWSGSPGTVTSACWSGWIQPSLPLSRGSRRSTSATVGGHARPPARSRRVDCSPCPNEPPRWTTLRILGRGDDEVVVPALSRAVVDVLRGRHVGEDGRAGRVIGAVGTPPGRTGIDLLSDADVHARLCHLAASSARTARRSVVTLRDSARLDLASVVVPLLSERQTPSAKGRRWSNTGHSDRPRLRSCREHNARRSVNVLPVCR